MREFRVWFKELAEENEKEGHFYVTEEVEGVRVLDLAYLGWAQLDLVVVPN